jgi:hypothetical protein
MYVFTSVNLSIMQYVIHHVYANMYINNYKKCETL